MKQGFYVDSIIALLLILCNPIQLIYSQTTGDFNSTTTTVSITLTNTTTISTSSSTTVPAVPSTTIAATPIDPSTVSACLNSCVTTFRNAFSRNVNDTSHDSSLKGLLLCYNNSGLETGNNSYCLTEFSSNNCTTMTSVLKSNMTTSLGLLCLTTGRLAFFSWSSTCNQVLASNPSGGASVPLSQVVGNLTQAFCSSGMNTTLNCSQQQGSPTEVILNSPTFINGALKASGCLIPTVAPLATTTIGLSQNPVGEDAITAIVVLVCLGIICILAGFFFWPKCHISEKELLMPKKTKSKFPEGENAVGGVARAHTYDGPVRGGGVATVQYNAQMGSANVGVPPTFGPSAA